MPDIYFTFYIGQEPIYEEEPVNFNAMEFLLVLFESLKEETEIDVYIQTVDEKIHLTDISDVIEFLNEHSL